MNIHFILYMQYEIKVLVLLYQKISELIFVEDSINSHLYQANRINTFNKN